MWEPGQQNGLEGAGRLEAAVVEQLADRQANGFAADIALRLEECPGGFVD